MTGLGLPGNGVLYAYEDNSNLVAVTAYVDTNDTPYGQSTRTFEDHRNLVHTVENQWKVSGTMTTISMYDYASDALGRRTSVINTGTAFSPNRFTLWTYEAPATPEISRGELLTSKRYDGTDIGNTNSPVSTQQFAFDYDAAGNRQWHTGSSSEGALSYTTNKLNQYTSTTTPDESFTYDRAGNLTHDGKNEYAYDAENRLVLVTPNRPTGWVGTLPVKVQFTYDCLGRRVRKVGWTWDPNLNGGRGDWSPQMSLDRRFVYDGRNLIEELNGLASNFPLFKYTWGLDLAAQGGASGCGAGTASPGGLHAAEGVAGLLAMYDTKGTSFAGDDRWMAYFYNGNGDVGQLIDSNPSVVITFGSTQARYEYYPFGGLLVATGPYAATNSIRYSTRYRDTENSLYYFGRRFLITRLGRWLNADPKGEAGGLNLYEAMHNDPVDRIDPLGLACASGSCGGGASTMWVTPWLPLLPPCLPLASPPTGLPPMVKGGGGAPYAPPPFVGPVDPYDPCPGLRAAWTDPQVQAFVAQLRAAGCSIPEPSCDRTPSYAGRGTTGGCSSNTNTGTLTCYGAVTSDMLLHELTHFWQACPTEQGGGGHPPYYPPGPVTVPPEDRVDLVACDEIQAAAAAGNCKNYDRKVYKNEESCIIATCARSLDSHCQQAAVTGSPCPPGWSGSGANTLEGITDWALAKCRAALSDPNCDGKLVPIPPRPQE